MGFAQRQPWRIRKHTLTPGAATLLGVAFGCTLAILCALAPPHDFSPGFLMILLVSLGPTCGLFGYILWLSVEPVRWARLMRITRLIAFPMLLALPIAFPGLWWHIGRSSEPLLVLMSVGGICGAAMLAAGAGCGVFHLVDHLVSLSRQPIKPGATSRTDGIWDRELDQG